MGSNENVIGVVIVLVIISVGLIFFDLNRLNFDEELEGDVVVGGERDGNGCLVSAGYSWNESELSCVMEWEMGVMRFQVVDFVTCVDAGYKILKFSPRQCRAPNGNLFIER